MPGYSAVGSNTKNTFLHTEAHKTTVEFTTAAAVKQGQLIKLTAAGLATPWAAADLQHTCIGIAYSDAASGGLVTVWTRGYVMILGLSLGALAAGPITYDSYDTTNAPVANPGTTGYNKFKIATDVTDCIGWNLDQAAGANVLIRILIKD